MIKRKYGSEHAVIKKNTSEKKFTAKHGGAKNTQRTHFNEIPFIREGAVKVLILEPQLRYRDVEHVEVQAL